jgi:hypothetical protein
MVIDGSYHVGFSWARQPGLRVTKDFGNKIWLGFSVENAETTLTAHGENNNFLVGAFGTSAGSLNPVANYAFTTAPDFVFKAAFEPGWGHYEIFGVISTFRDRVFPNETASTPSAAGAFNDRRAGGGIGANARVPLFHKKLDAGLHFFGGDGIGRYGASTLADVTVRPNGTLAPIRSFQSLGTLEWHTTPQLDVYAYVGGEYDARTAYAKVGATINNEGYGPQGLPITAASPSPFREPTLPHQIVSGGLLDLFPARSRIALVIRGTSSRVLSAFGTVSTKGRRARFSGDRSIRTLSATLGRAQVLQPARVLLPTEWKTW